MQQGKESLSLAGGSRRLQVFSPALSGSPFPATSAVETIFCPGLRLPCRIGATAVEKQLDLAGQGSEKKKCDAKARPRHPDKGLVRTSPVQALLS